MSAMARTPTTTDAFNAVAEASRRDLLDALGTGEATVGELVDRLGLSQPQVSKHLGVLRAVGLVLVRVDGRRRWYRVNGPALKPIHDWVRTFERTWNTRLDRLDDLLVELQSRGGTHHERATNTISNRHGSAVITLPSDTEILDHPRSSTPPPSWSSRPTRRPSSSSAGGASRRPSGWCARSTCASAARGATSSASAAWRSASTASTARSTAPHRLVSTEVFEGCPDPEDIRVNTMTLDEVDGVTTMTMLVQHSTQGAPRRDQLASGHGERHAGLVRPARGPRPQASPDVRWPWRRRTALRVWNLHHLAFGNIGDRECTPFRWFSHLAGEELDLRDESLNGGVAESLTGEVIVLGGGGLFLPLCWQLYVQPLLDRGNTMIGWGIGHHHDNVHLGPDEHPSDWSASVERYRDDYPIERFRRLGVRDWNTGLRWVPDASCMHPAFDATYSIDHDVVVYEHGMLEPIPLDGSEAVERGRHGVRERGRVPRQWRVVVTNSYHGAYWATLLGRPTLVWQPWCSKFLLLRYPLPWVGPETWEQAATEAPVYPGALAECRAATLAFAGDVFQDLRELATGARPAG